MVGVRHGCGRAGKETLQREALKGSVKGEKRAFRKLMKKRAKAYDALGQRLDREEKLSSAVDHIEARRNLSKKGKRYKVKDAEEGRPAVYVWKAERQK